ncbi:MAG: hypothetical protein GEU74_06830 [Nitriliruptorales bacterium]|nr:hypothetical protein [Nitriliruptorales bacterium]
MRRLIAAAAAVVAVMAAPAGAAQPDVTAGGAVLWDPADDRVLWGEGERKPLQPASTTKIMTVLLALEAGTIDDRVTVSAKAVKVARSPGAATLNLTAGQRIAMRSLLAGLILRSGNDGAVAVAEHVAGSEGAFVDRMNARAAELGMTDTNFINASGLTESPKHHASALDLAKLAEVALRNDDFATWASAPALSLDGLGSLTSRNELLGRYRGATGVKTGYTDVAGLCLVASARRGGRALVAVVLQATGGLGAATHFTESAAILDHGFSDFRRAQPLRRGDRPLRYRWSDLEVPLEAATAIGRTVAADEEARWRVLLDPAPQRPLQRGAALGVVELMVDGEVVDSAALTAARPVAAAPDLTGTEGAGAAVEDALRVFARMHADDRAA